MENNDLLYEYLHGFRHNRSCATQLVSFINDLAKCYDNGKQTDVIFMDIAKAFDTVPHNRLRHKLQWYGIAGNTYQSISSFLSDHHKKVVIDNVGLPWFFAKTLIEHTPKSHLKKHLSTQNHPLVALYNDYRSPSKYQVKKKAVCVV